MKVLGNNFKIENYLYYMAQKKQGNVNVSTGMLWAPDNYCMKHALIHAWKEKDKKGTFS